MPEIEDGLKRGTSLRPETASIGSEIYPRSWFGLVGWTPSIGRKVGFPFCLTKGAVGARLKPLFQAD